MMCSLKKNAVIFQVGNNTKDPIMVIEQKAFTKQEPDSSVPLLGIYNGYHFQSVLPASKADEELTEEIVKYFPSFQGNFKSFLAHKVNHQKMKRDLVSTIVQENSSSEHEIFQCKPTTDGTSYSCDVAFSEESNSEIESKDIETNDSDILSQKTQKVSEIDASEVTNDSDILPQKTQKVSEIDGSEVTNESDILPQKTQVLLEMDGSKKTSIFNQGANQRPQCTARTKSKKQGPNKPIFKDKIVSTQVNLLSFLSGS